MQLRYGPSCYEEEWMQTTNFISPNSQICSSSHFNIRNNSNSGWNNSSLIIINIKLTENVNIFICWHKILSKNNLARQTKNSKQNKTPLIRRFNYRDTFAAQVLSQKERDKN